MKAAKERAIQDKGGVPLEEGEKWLLTTKACHDLLTDRAEYRRRLVAHETKVEEKKMVRRGKKTLPGDMVCEIMTDTMAHRLLRDDETGLGGKNLRQELLKRESEIGDVAQVLVAANRFRRKGRIYGQSAAERRSKKKREDADVPRYGYPTFTYLSDGGADAHLKHHNEKNINLSETVAVIDESQGIENENGESHVEHADSAAGTTATDEDTIYFTIQEGRSQVIEGEHSIISHVFDEGDQHSDIEKIEQGMATMNLNQDSVVDPNSTSVDTIMTVPNVANKKKEEDEEEEEHHHQVLNRFKQVAHKGLSRKKLRDCRLRMILPVGDEETTEQIFWEKVGVPRVIPGQEVKSNNDEKPRALHWWEKDSSNDSQSHHGRKGGDHQKSTSDETLMQTNQKIRMNREMGWRPGLLRHVDVVDDDPADWMRRARQQRTVAKQNDPLESLFWEKEGKPPLPDPFSITEEVARFLNLKDASSSTSRPSSSSNRKQEKQSVTSSDRGDEEEDGGEEEHQSSRFKGTFKWTEEKVDMSGGSGGGLSGTGKSCPDGRVHHTLTVFPACWAPRKNTVDWLRPGMSLVFMFGGRRFVPPPVARRGDPTKGRYRPSPTLPTNELWSYTPQLYKWQNLTEYCKGKGSGPRSRHTTAIVRGDKSVNLLVFGGLDLHNNSKNDLFLLDLTTLCWTEVQLRGVPPPIGLGAACMTEAGKDIIVTKDKDVEAETDAERKNGIPAAMGVWRLKLSSHPEEKYSSQQTWLGLWSRAPRRLPSHGAGHTITTLGRSQVVFGGLAAETGDIVSMSLGSLKVLGKGSGFGNPVLESNSTDTIEKKYEIVQGRRRNRERKRMRKLKIIGSISDDDEEEEEDEDEMLLRGTDVTFEKHLEPLPRRLGKGAGAIGQRLIATPDPKRAIKYNQIAGSEEDGRFRNPLRDGLQSGSLGLVPVSDVSASGMRKLLCAPDKKLEEIKLKPKKSRVPKSIISSSSYDSTPFEEKNSSSGGIDVGGSSLDDWLRITEKASEESGGLGGRGFIDHHNNTQHKMAVKFGGRTSEETMHTTAQVRSSIGDYHHKSISSIGGGEVEEDELTLVHHQSIPSQHEKQSQIHLKDHEEEAYDAISLARGSGSRGGDHNHHSSSFSSSSNGSKSLHGGEFGKGAVWEPATWIRPWAKAGIRRLVDPPPRQYHASVAVSKRHLVICGGELGGPLNENVSEDSEFKYRVSSGVYLLDLQTSEWSQLPVCNPVRRAGHALVCVDGKLLSFGGRTAPLPATKPFPVELLCLEYDG